MPSLRWASISTTLSGSSRPVTRLATRSAQAWSVSPAGAGRCTPSSHTRQPSSSRRSAVRVRLPSLAVTVRSWRPGSGRHSLSFCRTVFARVIVVSQGFHRVFGAVEGEHRGLVFHDGLQVHGPTPNILDILKRVGRAVQFQVDTVVL